MWRRDFLTSARLVSAFLMTMKPVRLHKSVWRKNECSCFCFQRGAIRRLESRRNSRAGVTSSKKDGPVRCRRAKAFFHGCSSRHEKGPRSLFSETVIGCEFSGVLLHCQGGELNSRPRAYESPALPLSYPGEEFLLAELPAVLNQSLKADS